MKILIVTQYFPPEPVPLPADLAEGLAARGHEVRVLTGFPNYPTGRLAEGYRQSWRSYEAAPSYEILRVPLYADHSLRAIRRAWNYVSFALSSATVRKFGRDADVIYVYATQMTAAFGPWIKRILGGAPYVLHVQDLWPESVTSSSLVAQSRLVRVVSRTINVWLRSVYRRSSGVIAIAPTMRSMLLERGARPRDVSVVYNWARDSSTRRRSDSEESHCHVIYAGNVGEMQDLETVVRAAALAAHANVILTIVGDGVARARLESITASLGAKNVRFADPVPSNEMMKIYSEAKFGIVSLRNLAIFRGTVPSKLQSMLAAGLPIISTVPGDVRAIVEDSGAGLAVDPEDVDALASAFVSAAELSQDEWRSMRERARQLYESRFSREAGITNIEALLVKAARAE